MPDPKPMLYQDYCEALAAWLRSLADAVERADVEPTDVAQALFAADTYTVGCPLSEAQSETGDDLNEASKVFYPAPTLTGAKEPGDARWRPTKTLAERVELIITLCDALKREAVTGADPGYGAGIRYAAQSILDALPKHSVSDGVLP